MNQKCIRCSAVSDELRCYDCYKKIRNIYVPHQVMDVQRQFIVEHQEILRNMVKDRFQDLINLNAIERISLFQKKYCDEKDDLQDKVESLESMQKQIQEILITNMYKRKRIELLKAYLEKQKQEEKKVCEELEKRDTILLNLKKRKVEMSYNLRVINHAYPNWSINGELEKLEIPFYNKKSSKQEKSYQNYIMFKKKWNFLTQVQQQQFLFSLNQIALFIHGLQAIFKISSHFPLIRKPREQITISGDSIRIYDDNFRTIYDENIIYIYLNYKLILQRFNINTTRNPYFFFDFSYFKERFLARKSRNDKSDKNDGIRLHTHHLHDLHNHHPHHNFTVALSHSNNVDFQDNEDDNLINQNQFRQKQDSIFINLESMNQIPVQDQFSKTPQRALQHHLIQSEQHLVQTQEQFRVRSLTHLEEYNKTASSPFNQQVQHSNNFIPEQGKTFRLLFVKSPLIKIEYEDNLKQKEIGFNDPYIYGVQKVVQGGWEVYDADDY